MDDILYECGILSKPIVRPRPKVDEKFIYDFLSAQLIIDECDELLNQTGIGSKAADMVLKSLNKVRIHTDFMDFV